MVFNDLEPYVRAAAPWHLKYGDMMRTTDGRCPLGTLPNAVYRTPTHYAWLQQRTGFPAALANEVRLAADNVPIPDEFPELAQRVAAIRATLTEWCGL